MGIQSSTFSRRLLPLALGLVIALAGAPRAHAAKFANQFIEFELPPQWQCNLEAAEWVCQSLNEAKKREAIIVLAAKLKGDQDSLEQYEAYLKKGKSYVSVQGKPVNAEVKYVKRTPVNGQDWVDSLQLGSELPGYYTRYLGTVKSDIGVLLTYSIVQDKYQAYMSQFEDLVGTLKVFRRAPAPPPAAGGGANGPVINIPTEGPNPFAAMKVPQVEEKKHAPKAAESGGMLGLLLLVAGVGAFLYFKKRRNG